MTAWLERRRARSDSFVFPPVLYCGFRALPEAQAYTLTMEAANVGPVDTIGSARGKPRYCYDIKPDRPCIAISAGLPRWRPADRHTHADPLRYFNSSVTASSPAFAHASS